MRVPGQVNVLGYTHMDYCNDCGLQQLLEALEHQGETAGCVLGYGGVESVPRLLEAQRSIVVSAAALPLARQLEQVAGIPYSCALPVGGSALSEADSALPVSAGLGAGVKVLVVGDQVMSCALRDFIGDRYGAICDVACMPRLDAQLARGGDARVKNEHALAKKVAQGYEIVIVDPLLAPVVDHRQLFFGLPRPAVSGMVYQHTSIPLFGCDITDQLDQVFCML